MSGHGHVEGGNKKIALLVAILAALLANAVAMVMFIEAHSAFALTLARVVQGFDSLEAAAD